MLVSLTFLVLPAIVALAVPSWPALQPLANILFVLATAAAALWAGTAAGILVSFAAISVFSIAYSHGGSLWPHPYHFTGLAILLGVAILVGQIASARRRTERLLQAANAQLENRVLERTQELELMREKLQLNNDELQHFAYAVSHDLKEPLRHLKISSQMLERKLDKRTASDVVVLAQRIGESATRLEALLDDLLGYMQSWADEPEQTSVSSLEDIFALSTKMLEAIIIDTGARVRCECSTKLPIAALHLQQILQNLISNALKYRSEQPPEITVSAEWSDSACVVRVSDNGIGIDSAYHERIFQPFQRLHAKAAYPGTGLGLAVCNRIVTRYGGRMWVESEPGQGSTFCFSLPLNDRPSTKLQVTD